ncbi:MAG: hypothetical protein CML17_00630 [Pusillimonas sp.]|nr:hypothetical protein [Pusillimonas sp.]
MPGKKFRFAYSLAAMAAVVALQAPVVTAAEPANAQTQVNSNDRYDKHHKGQSKRHARSHQRDVAFMVPGYGPVGQKTLDSLNLTDTQKQKIEAARVEQQALRATHRNGMRSNMQERFAQLEAGKIDPHAAVQAMRGNQEKMMQQRTNVTGKWLEAWDALDADQRNALTQALAKRHEQRKGKMQRQSAS